MRTLIQSLILFVICPVFAQGSVTYKLDLKNIHHHELRVKISFTDLESDQLTIRMPNTSPGRYAIHNFVKNLYEEVAYDATGNEVSMTRTTPYSWKLPVTDGSVSFEYTIYGNHADGTYLGVDARKLHMNMPATFAYGEGLENQPVTLIIPARANWNVATQLVKVNDTTYTAPDYAYFYDSPTVAGEMSWRRWEVDGQTLEIAAMHDSSEEALDQYTEWIKKIVNEQKKIFGELPRYDYGKYTFILSYNDWVHRDAMEHRNSTICTHPGKLGENDEQMIGSVSHEFLHCWTIERIRPASLEPFDFDQPNLSEGLWFGEGFTNYYEDYTLVRAGIKNPEQYIKSLSGTINYVMNSPARAFRSPIDMSHMATFTDAGTANDETNYLNNFISYYFYGEVIALGLDLTLRLEYNTTLDEYMQLVWERHGQPEIPFTTNDLKSLLADLTRDEDFANQFFLDQIYGSALPDFTDLFEQFGVKISLQNPNSAFFNNPKLENGVVQSPVLRGTAFYDAGIAKGDKILTLSGYEIELTSDLNRAINRMEVGKTYEVTYEQMGEMKTSSFTTRQDPRITLSYLPDRDLKKSAIKRRNAWLKIDQ